MPNSDHIHQTIDQLFRLEWGKLVAVLTKLFGTENLQLAEDVVQETLLTALNNWKINGLPNNPEAWLFSAARNKAIDALRKQQLHQQYARNITPLLKSEYSLSPTVHELVNANSIDDDQLKMMFVCCHPNLSSEAQVAIILKTLCGFSVAEIAKAFVCNYDTVEKRLYRARQALKENNVSFDLPNSTQLNERLENVLTALYLLFNEGYNSTHHDDLIRTDLMQEAIRLCELTCKSKLVHNGAGYALLSLMCFTAARNKARIDIKGNIVLLKGQDRSLWDFDLIKRAIAYLDKSSISEQISRYHIEAGIAFEHAKAKQYADTNWKNILHYYDVLYQLQPSPIIALNRAIVIAETHGAATAIEAIHAIPTIEQLKNFYLLPATLGELHSQLGEKEKALVYFNEAMQLTQSAAEKYLLQQKKNRMDQ